MRLLQVAREEQRVAAEYGVVAWGSMVFGLRALNGPRIVGESGRRSHGEYQSRSLNWPGCRGEGELGEMRW